MKKLEELIKEKETQLKNLTDAFNRLADNIDMLKKQQQELLQKALVLQGEIKALKEVEGLEK